MSWHLDKNDFYEMFQEIFEERGMEGVKEWAWVGLEYTQDQYDILYKENRELKDEIIRLKNNQIEKSES
jgi:hypothetical protein